jgi:hypothetical protein
MTCCVPIGGDIQINRSDNTPPVKWQFLTSLDPEVLFSIDGASFKLTVEWPVDHQLMVDSLLSSALIVEPTTSTVLWEWTPQDVADFPAGRIADYRLQQRINGSVQTFVEGKVIVEGISLEPAGLLGAAGENLTDEFGSYLTDPAL